LQWRAGNGEILEHAIHAVTEQAPAVLVSS
jgi:hypothetical protein